MNDVARMASESLRSGRSKSPGVYDVVQEPTYIIGAQDDDAPDGLIYKGRWYAYLLTVICSQMGWDVTIIYMDPPAPEG